MHVIAFDVRKLADDVTESKRHANAFDLVKYDPLMVMSVPPSIDPTDGSTCVTMAPLVVRYLR